MEAYQSCVRSSLIPFYYFLFSRHDFLSHVCERGQANSAVRLRLTECVLSFSTFFFQSMHVWLVVQAVPS